MRYARRRRQALFLAALALGACDTGTKTAGIDRGGLRMPVIAAGPITGFGSIVVNGVRYETGMSAVRVNGATGSVTDLALGQFVVVVGERTPEGGARADSVAFEANVRGPVESAAPGALVVLGQPVAITADTVVDLGPLAASSPAVGDAVEVSGLVDAGGTILATRIAAAGAAEGLRVRGVVNGNDAVRPRFMLNDLTVDYSSAFVIDGFPAGLPRDGDGVIVTARGQNADGSLRAETLVYENASIPRPAGHEAEVEVEGLITRFATTADFDVSGSAVTSDAATVYEGGGPADLALNVKIQVEGRVDARGVIAARKIEVKDGGHVYDDD